MDTPICDFVKNYIKKRPSRFHMPGHKGKGDNINKYDITEVKGADVLYHEDGIIAKSQQNATSLFGSLNTFYSVEGSTLSIKVMVGACCDGETSPLILACRNAHKAFIYACALLNVEVKWLYPKASGHLTECVITPDILLETLKNSPRLPTAVYLTSPDYLGNTLDISGLAKVCDQFNLPLIIDNAHGAYLKFLTPSMHPIDLGATMCVDSAHKTLPVITGGGYLHVAKKGAKYVGAVKRLLPVFASTSPSYLIMQSLDKANAIIDSDFAKKLNGAIEQVKDIKTALDNNNLESLLLEPLKLSVHVAKNGYTCSDFYDVLRKNGIEPEFIDNDFAVFMCSPYNSKKDFARLKKALLSLQKKPSICLEQLAFVKGDCVMPIKTAVFSPSIIVDVKDAVGKISSSPTVSCPPAIPIVVSGEVITEEHLKLFKRYNVTKISVVDN
jgi:arginine/lysine/ornithine decarboxylase